MKYTLVLSALAALVAAADKPSFLNNNFQVVQGQPFTFEFNNCQGGCTILLQNGPSTNLQNVKTVTATTSGNSFTWTPEGVASGTYAFRIVNNANQEYNFSQQFTYVGTGATTAASGASTAVISTGTATPSSTGASSTGASSIVTSAASQTESTTESSSTATTTISTASIVTSSASATTSSLSTTTAPSSTTSRSSTSTTRSTTSATTTVPNAGVRATPMAFVAGAIAALAYLG